MVSSTGCYGDGFNLVILYCFCFVLTLPGVVHYRFHCYAPNFEKVDGAYCFWCVRAWVTLFVPTVTFKPLKLES